MSHNKQKSSNSGSLLALVSVGTGVLGCDNFVSHTGDIAVLEEHFDFAELNYKCQF